MVKKSQTIPAGSLLLIATGAYSDYSVEGAFRALQDINADQLRTEWLVENPQQKYIDEKEFIAWVFRKGLLEWVECFELYILDSTYDCAMTVSKYELS